MPPRKRHEFGCDFLGAGENYWRRRTGELSGMDMRSQHRGDWDSAEARKKKRKEEGSRSCAEEDLNL
jgi:hypothetical protein